MYFKHKRVQGVTSLGEDNEAPQARVVFQGELAKKFLAYFLLPATLHPFQLGNLTVKTYNLLQ
jgi:hypothetical protein